MPEQSSPDATRLVVQDLLEAIACGDLDAISAMYADIVDFALNWPQSEIDREVPWIKRRSTNSDMVRHYSEIAALNRPDAGGTTIDDLLVDGADAVIFGTIRNRLVGNGAAYNARFALRLTVQKGRITRHHIYEDSLSVFQAWNGKGTPDHKL